MRTLVLLAVALLTAGCQNPWTPLAPAPPPQPPRPLENMDACSDRLDQLCGRLMVYYATYRRLPAQLEDLGTPADPLPPDALVCPVSKKPYVYDPAGVRVLGLQGRLIVYDYDPCHDGLRWGILAVQIQPGKPAIWKVIRPRNDAIVWREPVHTAAPPPVAPGP